MATTYSSPTHSYSTLNAPYPTGGAEYVWDEPSVSWIEQQVGTEKPVID